jgi:hypothetical protein
LIHYTSQLLPDIVAKRHNPEAGLLEMVAHPQLMQAEFRFLRQCAE